MTNLVTRKYIQDSVASAASRVAAVSSIFPFCTMAGGIGAGVALSSPVTGLVCTFAGFAGLMIGYDFRARNSGRAVFMLTPALGLVAFALTYPLDAADKRAAHAAREANQYFRAVEQLCQKQYGQAVQTPGRIICFSEDHRAGTPRRVVFEALTSS